MGEAVCLSLYVAAWQAMMGYTERADFVERRVWVKGAALRLRSLRDPDRDGQGIG